MRLLGAILVLTATTCTGFRMAAACRLERAMLWDLTAALERMRGEIQWSQPPLSELCRLVGGSLSPQTSAIFSRAADALDREVCAREAFKQAMKQAGLPNEVQQIWAGVAETFSRFDPEQQAAMLQAALLQMRQLATRAEETSRYNSRKCRIFGMSAGAALVILLL